jgi:hypothetical protein
LITVRLLFAPRSCYCICFCSCQYCYYCRIIGFSFRMPSTSQTPIPFFYRHCCACPCIPCLCYRPLVSPSIFFVPPSPNSATAQQVSFVWAECDTEIRLAAVDALRRRLPSSLSCSHVSGCAPAASGREGAACLRLLAARAARGSCAGKRLLGLHAAWPVLPASAA